MKNQKQIEPLLLFVLIVFMSLSAVAGNVDSFRGVVIEYSREDTNKVNLMLKLSKEYQGESLDSMSAFAERAVLLSRKLHFDKGEADALVGTAYAYIYKGEMNNAFAYLRKADPIYEKIHNGRGRILVANAQAVIYSRFAKYDTALDYFNQVLTLAEPIHADDHIGKTHSSIGTIYTEMGNYPEAIKHFLKALKVQEKINDQENIILTLGRLASAYADLHDSVKAVEFINRFVAVDKGDIPPHMRMSAYVNIGSVYGKMNNNNTNALVFFRKALAIADSTHDLYWRSSCMIDIAEIYADDKKYEEAIIAYTESMNSAEKIGMFNIYASSKIGIGKIMLATGKTAEAIKYLKNGYDMLLQNGVIAIAAQAADEMSKGYATLHDYKNALEYRNIYVKLKDSVNNEEGGKKIQQLQFDYQIEKKQAQMMIEKGKSEKQRTIIGAMVAGLVLFIIIIILLYQSRLYERRNGELIKKKNKEIQLQTTKLEELNLFKDKTFSVLSHDLRSPINNLTSTMDLFDEEMISQEEFIAIKPQISKQLESLNILLDNLLKWSKSHIMGESGMKIEQLDIYRIANDNINLILSTAEKKQVAVHNNIAKHTYAMGDNGQIDIVIRNLINNALKFTNTNGLISLSAIEENNKVKISVTDNGVGMTQAQMDKLFTSATDNTTYGTGGEKGTGLGLLLCYEFIKSNNGTIEVTSEVGKGTTFTLVLPN